MGSFAAFERVGSCGLSVDGVGTFSKEENIMVHQGGGKTSATAVLAIGAIGSAAEVPRERARFRELLLGNPNYFGTLADSAFSPVLSVERSVLLLHSLAIEWRR